MARKSALRDDRGPFLDDRKRNDGWERSRSMQTASGRATGVDGAQKTRALFGVLGSAGVPKTAKSHIWGR